MIGTLSDTNSLSLAIDARAVISALTASEESGRLDQQTKQVLTDAIASLKALKSGAPLFEHLSASSSFDSYEQIRTVREAEEATADENLSERLMSLVKGSEGKDLEENVTTAITFFTAIENRALQRFNRSFQAGI